MLKRRALRLARAALPRTATGWSTAVVAILLFAGVAWLAFHLLGVWAWAFLASFSGVFWYSMWKQRREDRAKQRAATQAHIEQMEHELRMR